MDESPASPSASAQQAQDAVGDEREQFRLLIENIEDYAILVADPERRVATWNAGAERLLGYRPDEILGRSADVIFTPEDNEKGAPDWEARTAVEHGRAINERWHVRKDGSRFWGSGIMTALFDESRQLRGFCKIMRDFTQRRRYQQMLEAALERERRITDALQRAMLVPVEDELFDGVTVATQYEAAWDEALVGGDFFDVFLVRDRLAAFVVGDASGKGLVAAARTTQVKDVLRALLRTQDDVDAARTFARLNDYLCDSKRLDKIDDEGFMTLTLALMDMETGETTLAVAGAEPPILLRHGGGAEVMETTNVPLGILSGSNFRISHCRLLPGDALLLVTDGITEARYEDEFLMLEGTIELAKRFQSSASVKEMTRSILDGAKAFAGGKLHDDACILLVRRRE